MVRIPLSLTFYDGWLGRIFLNMGSLRYAHFLNPLFGEVGRRLVISSCRRLSCLGDLSFDLLFLGFPYLLNFGTETYIE